VLILASQMKLVSSFSGYPHREGQLLDQIKHILQFVEVKYVKTCKGEQHFYANFQLRCDCMLHDGLEYLLHG